MAAAASICGVSAAIAAGAAVAKKKETTYVTALVIVTTMPWIAQAFGLPGGSANSPSGSGFDPLAALFPDWERLYGPPGGYVKLIDQCDAASDVMCVYSKEGENEGAGRSDFRGTVMKPTDGSSSWYSITTGCPSIGSSTTSSSIRWIRTFSIWQPSTTGCL